MQPLPPEVVFGVDQRTGVCNKAIDDLIAKYRRIAKSHGSAAATGITAHDIAETKILGIPYVVDVLAAAIARLAEAEKEKP